jgi:ABC-type glycerol-3-phosphate transport system substrate-binding protein
MRTWKILLATAVGAVFAANAWAQSTTLRIFTGGQQRPDVMRKIADEYQKKNPNVKIEVEVGGATSEAQQQYLSTVLSAKDSVLDVVLIDVIRPAQWAAQGWAEPLDGYLGADKAKILSQYLKAYADADQVNGKLNLDTTQARLPFQLYGRMKQAGVLPKNIAEIPTDRIRIDMQAGNLIFGMTWGYVWNRLENDADSKVKGKIGVTTLPHDPGGKSATCIGGWQLAVSAYSKNKVEAVKFARWLSSPETSKMQAILASHMPVFPSVYKDPEVLKANPWFADALPVVEGAKSRPVSAQYPQVSDVIRSNMNAYLAGTKTTDVALADMKSRLAPILH